MAQNARRLKELVHRAAEEAPPAAPKAAGRSIASFFGGSRAAGKAVVEPGSKRQRVGP